MAANPLRGEASFSAGGKDYTLVFDANAFCFAEAEIAKTTDEIVAEIEAAPANLTIMRALFWAGLQKHHAGTHMVAAGEIISDLGVVEARVKMMDAMFAAFGKTEGGDITDPPKRKGRAGTG